MKLATTKRESRRTAESGLLTQLTRERDEAQRHRLIMANDVALLERALLDIECIAPESKPVIAIIHRVLGKPEERTG